MGGFMPPLPEPEPVAVRDDEGMAETLRHVEVLGRLILRTIQRLERQMAERNYTTEEILLAVRQQKTEIASMGAMLGSIKERLNVALAGEISPKGQAILNDVMSEIQGNSRAMSYAVRNNDDDPTNDVDENGNPIPPGTPGTLPPPAETGGQTGGQIGGTDPNAPINEPTADLAATTTKLETSKAVAGLSEDVTFTATVEAAEGTDRAITGMVSFATESGSIGRSGVTDGKATMTTVVPAGDHSIAATYEGDDHFASSTSEAITQSALDQNQSQGEAPTGAQVDPATQAPPATETPAPAPNPAA